MGRSIAVKKIVSRLFWPVLLVVFAVSLAVVLWNGKEREVGFREMACTFENYAPGCIDTVEAWRDGIAFFDSSLSVTSDTLGVLKSLLWNFWNIEFAGAGDSAVTAESILPLRVLERRKSGCMGLAWVAMMVAEARQLPLSAILLPGHVYLQYAPEGKFPVNLEPNRRGYSYTDNEYREKYREGHWTGLEFKPLSASQFVGLAAFDMGNLYLESELKRALSWYRLAGDLFPEYPGIRVNQDIAKSRLPDKF